MKTFIINKNGKDIVFKGETANDIIKQIYEAGANGTLALNEVITFTDRIEVFEGNDEAGLFSWTEDITPERIKDWKENGITRERLTS